jgi:hypothetical protein
MIRVRYHSSSARASWTIRAPLGPGLPRRHVSLFINSGLLARCLPAWSPQTTRFGSYQPNSSAPMRNHVADSSPTVDDLLWLPPSRMRRDYSAIPQTCFSAPFSPSPSATLTSLNLKSTPSSFNVLSRPCITRARSVLYLLYDLILNSCVSQRGSCTRPLESHS